MPTQRTYILLGGPGRCMPPSSSRRSRPSRYLRQQPQTAATSTTHQQPRTAARQQPRGWSTLLTSGGSHPSTYLAGSVRMAWHGSSQQQAPVCSPLLTVLLVLLLASGVRTLAHEGQIPKPAGSADMEQSLSGIATGASMQTLRGIKDSQMMTATALRNVLSALAQVAANHPGQAGTPDKWLALQGREPRLVRYIKLGGPDSLLMELLRSLLDGGASNVQALVTHKEKLLLEFARAFDPDAFYHWAEADISAEQMAAPSTDDSSRHDGSTHHHQSRKHPIKHNSPTSAPSPVKAKGTPRKHTPSPSPRAGSPQGKRLPSPKPGKSSQKLLAKSPKKQTPAKPIGHDNKDPVDQLYDWAHRLKALGGSLGYLLQGEARRRSRSLLAFHGDDETNNVTRASGGRSDAQEMNVTRAAGASGHAARTAPATHGPGAPPAANYTNVGFEWFKTRHIGVVFHMLQFRDKQKYLYPPQAYWNGDDPAKRLLAAIKKIYLYSGTNIQFYLKDYRINVRKHPYLDVGNLYNWQNISNFETGITCELAQKHNYQSHKYINVYVAGSNAYRRRTNPHPGIVGLTSAMAGIRDLCNNHGEGGAWDNLRSTKLQHIWFSFDFVDPLQHNSADFANDGATSLGHEFGHLLGLEHAFNDEPDRSGSVCGKDEDGVPDTPVGKQGLLLSATMQNELARICLGMAVTGELPKREQLSKFDSCPQDAYIDNVFNFMNYVPAACNLLITRGQVRLLQNRTQKYLPDLGSDW